MKDKRYNENSKVFADLGKKIKAMFPQGNMKLGMHTEASNLYSIGYIKGKNMQPVSASVELEGDDVNLRIFRPGVNGPTYKIDMTKGVNKTISHISPKSDFDHYIYTDIPENIMSRNNISVKLILDKDGNLAPKRDEKGMVEVLINFPDPFENLGLKR